MGWNKVTKEELKEAGVDVEAFTSAMSKIGKIDELDTTVKGIKEATDGIAQIKEQFTSLENRIKELTSSPGNRGPVNPNANPSGSGNGSGESHEEELDWIVEPQKSVEKVIARMVTPVVTATADMRAQIHVSNFESQNKKGFKRYKTEIMELYNKQPLAAKQTPDMIENCYKIVIANHLDEIEKGGSSFFIESGGSGVVNPSGTGEKKKAVDVLTKDQLDLCNKWGIDPEDYLKEKMAIDGVTSYV